MDEGKREKGVKARAEKKGEREKEETNEINWRDAEAAVCFLNEQPICILNFAPEENGRSRVANNKYIDNRERVGKRVEKEFLSEREIKFSGMHGLTNDGDLLEN